MGNRRTGRGGDISCGDELAGRAISAGNNHPQFPVRALVERGEQPGQKRRSRTLTGLGTGGRLATGKPLWRKTPKPRSIGRSLRICFVDESGTVALPSIHPQIAGTMEKIAISPDAIARAIAFAIEQPADGVVEIIARPTAQA